MSKKLNILTLFVRHGATKYHNAINDLDAYFATTLSDVNRKLIVIDNANPDSVREIKHNNTVFMGGSNDYWEFSAWDTAIGVVKSELIYYDYVHFVTSAFMQHYVKYINLIDSDMLLTLRGKHIVVGHIDAYNSPVKLLGRVSQSWIRSSFLFMSPTVLRLLGSLVSLRDRSLFFSGDPNEPFLSQAPLCSEYRANIRNWLTGDGTGQGVAWHSRFDLTAETLPFFEAKALAIMNEQALSIRLRALGASTIDATWLAGYLRQEATKSLTASHLPHWREQLAMRRI